MFSLRQPSTNTVRKCVGQRVFSAVKTTIEPPVFLEFSQRKLGICGMFLVQVKRMENTKFSRICRFVRLLVNEAFLPCLVLAIRIEEGVISR